MMWQSTVIACVQALFGVLLLPTLLNRNAQVPRFTSVLMAVGLFVIAGVYVTLQLGVAILAASACGFMWLLVAVYRPVRRVNYASADLPPVLSVSTKDAEDGS